MCRQEQYAKELALLRAQLEEQTQTRQALEVSKLTVTAPPVSKAPALATAPAAAKPSRKASVGSKVLAGFTLDHTSGKPVNEQLRDALAKHAGKILDLFREWDKDGDGEV